MKTYKIHQGDNLPFLESLPEKSIDLIYMDPPFNTGELQVRERIKVRSSSVPPGPIPNKRKGFGNKEYEVLKADRSASYADSYDDFSAFLYPRLLECWRILKDNGSLFVHLDNREVHYIKVLLDRIVGRERFMNDIIWSWDYGAKSKNKWSNKHNHILWYVKNPKNYTFNYDEIERIPYLAPELAGPEKAARGKILTSVWQMTIVPTNGKEKTGYPTQKPMKLLKQILKVHTNPNDVVLDCFAGSGTTGMAAYELDRSFILCDSNSAALDIMLHRFQPIAEQLIVTKQ